MAIGRLGTTPVLRTRWSKEPAGGTTSLSGLDDYSVSLVYEVGYEAVYQNGALLSRGNDYTATDGTTITLTNATVAGDIIEVFANNVVPLTDTYSQSVADGKFVNNTIVDAKGDLIVATGADTLTRLAVGTNGFSLVADSGQSSGVKWATPFVGCQMHIAGTSTAITQSAYVILSGWTEVLDTDAFHSTTTNTSRITIPSGLGGKYRIFMNFNGSTVWGTFVDMKLYKNGSVVTAEGLYDGETNNIETSNRPAVSGTAVLDLVANDYVELAIRSNVTTGNYNVYAQFGVERLAS